MLLRNCTIVSNTALTAHGGGICNYSLVAGTSNNISSTLVAGNSASGHADVIGVFTSGGYNLIGKIDYSVPAGGASGSVPTSGLTNGVNHDQVGSLASPINPLNGPLQDNGGTTPTMALLPGSPAIDKGLSNGFTTDQRGAPRTDPATGLCDVGAFELNPPPVVTTTNDAGVGSLRQAITGFVLGGTITFASNLTGTIALTNGELAIGKTLSIVGPTNSRVSISGNNSNRVLHIIGGSSVSISGLTITNGNSAAQGAGAFIEFGCALTLSNCAVVGNISSDNGGGIANNGSFAAYNCTFAGNQAFYTGGGIYTYAGPVLLRNCTVVSNSTVAAHGGGLCNYSLVSGTSNNISSSLVASNSAPGHADVIGVFTSGGYNLIGQIDYSVPTDGASAFVPTFGLTNGANHDQVGTLASPINPLIGPLRDNGGNTPTIALLTGSPAIDKGLSNGLTTDQRGAPRPLDFGSVANAAGGDGSDIGAFELGSPVLSIQRAGGNAVISWPTYYGAFTLQSVTNLPASNNWVTVAGAPSVIGSQAYLTNPIAGPRKFYRLTSP